MAFHVTQCPGCESTFNTTARILQSAAGKVRCGACLTVFNAVDYLIDDHNADEDDSNSVFVGSNPNDYFDPSVFITRSALTEPDHYIEPEPDFEREFGSALDTEFDADMDVIPDPAIDPTIDSVTEPVIDPIKDPVIDTPTIDTAIPDTSIVDTSVLDASTRDSSTINTSTPGTSTLDSAIDTSVKTETSTRFDTDTETKIGTSTDAPTANDEPAAPDSTLSHGNEAEDLSQQPHWTGTDIIAPTSAQTDEPQSHQSIDPAATLASEDYVADGADSLADPVAALDEDVTLIDTTTPEPEATEQTDETAFNEVNDPQFHERSHTLSESRDVTTLSFDNEDAAPTDVEPASPAQDAQDAQDAKDIEGANPESDAMVATELSAAATTAHTQPPAPAQSVWSRPAPEDIRIHASFTIVPAPARETQTAQPPPPESKESRLPDTQPEVFEPDSPGDLDLDAAPVSPEFFEITEVPSAAGHASETDRDTDTEVEASNPHFTASEVEEKFVEPEAADEAEFSSDDSTIFYLDEYDEIDDPADAASPQDKQQLLAEPQPALANQQEETAPGISDSVPTPTETPLPEPVEESSDSIRARAFRTDLRDEDALEALPEAARSVVGQHLPPLELLSGKERRWLQQVLLIAACVVLGALLAGQFLWQRLPVYSRIAEYRPIYEFACNYLACSLPTYTEISAIRSDNLVVRSHPTVDNALTVSLNFRNTAAFPQPFPVLILSFNSATNAVIALREFAPAEYLNAGLQNVELMPVMSPVQIGLEIIDPGADAVNYTVAFRRP